MLRRLIPTLLAGALGVALWSGSAAPGQAQTQVQSLYPVNNFFYYPYYYFPHNYWPNQGPKWPEPPGAPCLRPPAYMAFPPFKEPNWRYHYFEPLLHYRGFHFWLDVF